MVLVLQPKEAVAAITAYLVLGAVGVPVFSGMRGGIGVLAGATGGFLWGYLLGVGLAVAVRFGLKALLARDGQLRGARALYRLPDSAWCSLPSPMCAAGRSSWPWLP